MVGTPVSLEYFVVIVIHPVLSLCDNSPVFPTPEALIEYVVD